MLLRDVFEERATLPQLKGPAFRVIQKRLKGVLKGLRRLGNPLQKQEIKVIKDQANRAIFTLIKEEYIQVEIHCEVNPNNVSLIKKREEYLSILDRLRSETDIKEDLKPKQFQDLSFLNDLNVVEAA